MRRGRGVFARVLSLMLAVGGAVAAEPVDFGPGFEKLQALGLPDLKGAVWVKDAAEGSIEHLLRSFKGNAWRLADGKSVVGLGEAAVRPPQGEVSNGSGGEPATGLGNAVVGETSSLDPKTDAESLLTVLENRDSGLFQGPGGLDRAVLGRFFLFAAQLHAAGHASHANRLAAAVFSQSGDPEGVIDEAVSIVADDACGEVLGRFETSGDWLALSSQLNAVTQKFSRGWTRRDNMASLAERAAAMARAVPPLPSPLAPIPDALISSVSEWLGTRPGDPEPAPDEEAVPGGEDGLDAAPELWTLSAPADGPAFLKNGMAVLPALIPLLKDSSLTPVIGLDSPPQDPASYLLSMGGLPPPPSYLRVPLSRAERAAALLRTVIPDTENAEPVSLHAAALTFLNDHRSKSPLELAAVYLTSGSGLQQLATGTWLARNPGGEADEVFARWATDPGKAFERLEISRAWVRRRKSHAADFVAKLAGVLRASEGKPAPAAARNDIEDPFGGGQEPKVRTAEDIDGIIRWLELLASDSGLEAGLLAAAADARPAGPLLGAMRQDLAQLPPSQTLVTLIRAAAAATPANRLAFLNFISEVGAAPYGEFEPREPDPAIARDAKDALISLLENTEPIPVAERPQGDQDTIQSYVASLAPALVPGEVTVDPDAYLAITGRPVTGMLKDRALARLRGLTPPAWPDASKVSPERLSEMVQSVAGLTPPEVLKKIEALSADERAAWVDWITGYSEPEPPDSVKAGRLLISGTLEYSGGGANPWAAGTVPLITAAGMSVGTVLTPETLKVRCEALLSEAAKHSPLMIGFGHPGKLGLGLRVFAVRPAVPSADGEAAPADDPARPDILRSSAYAYFGEAAAALPDDAGAIVKLTITDQEFGECSTDFYLTKEGKPAGKSGPGGSALERLEKIMTRERAPMGIRIMIAVLTHEHAALIRGE